MAIVNFWGCHGNADCSNAWTELICRAQESVRLLPAVGGHKGWILIDSDASRSLPFPRHRRKLLQFQHIHIHTHIHYTTQQVAGMLFVDFVGNSIKSRNFNMHFFFPKHVLAYVIRRYPFLSRYDLSVLEGNLLASLQYFEGDAPLWKKINFTFWCLYSWLNTCSSFCYVSPRIFSIHADIDGWYHTFWQALFSSVRSFYVNFPSTKKKMVPLLPWPSKQVSFQTFAFFASGVLCSIPVCRLSLFVSSLAL